MADVKAAAARLRRSFQYPDADGSDAEHDAPAAAMDDQEQEALIARLAADNAARNNQFRRGLVALALLATLPCLPLLVHPPTVLLALLALTSLLSTACLLHRLPPAVTGIAPLDAWSRRHTAAASPLDAHLPYLNLALAAVLVLMGLATGRATGSLSGIGIANLPAIVYVIVLAAKMVMASVDPEAVLSALRYEYRGA